MSNDIEQTLDEAFPVVDPLMAPYGARVLVQLRAVKEKVTEAGILLPEETKETVVESEIFVPPSAGTMPLA